MCNHFFVEGFGGMGDAVVCKKCGLDKYPEAITLWVMKAKLLGRFIKEDHPEYKVHFQEAVEARKRRQ